MSQRTGWTGVWLIGLGLAAASCGAGAISASGSTTVPDDVTASSITTTTPAPTTTTVLPTTSTTLSPPVTTTTLPYVPGPLEPGDTGPDVTMLQEAMADAGFFRDVIDGVFGHRTATAVIAVHKALDLPRNASWTESDWEALAGFRGPVLPDRANEPDRVEIDLTRQLLYRVEDGTVV
ncbi:MAG: hypothetical protein OER12_10810, partial [Acidimicrobiia bacterium]|nr:hypothetical protein [Acidimicrobiia bacterium]